MRPLPAIACVLAAAAAVVSACGESRRPIGEECLRNEDCLSNVCAARSCVSAPALVTGASNPPDEEEPLIPGSDAAGGSSVVDASSDTKSDG